MEALGHSHTMIVSANRLLEKWIIIILPVVLFLGMQLQDSLQSLVSGVPYLFMYLTFVSSMNVSREQFKGLWNKPKAFIALLLLFHILLPIVNYVLIFHVYGGSSDLKLGLLLAMVMPIGVTSIVWVNLAKGNVGIAISMVAMDTLFSPLLIPLTLWLLVGKSVEMNTLQLIWGVMKLVVLPCVLGILAGRVLPNRGAIRSAMALSSKLTLYLIVLLNAAAMSTALTELQGSILSLLLAVSGIMVLGYGVSWLSMSRMKLLPASEIAFTYTGGIRNYTAGIVIAQLYFSPQTAIPVMFAILLQHPIALLAHTLFKRKEKTV